MTALLLSVGKNIGASEDLAQTPSHTVLDQMLDSKKTGPKSERSKIIQNVSKAVVNLYVVQVSKEEVFNPFTGDPFMDFFFGAGPGSSLARPRVSYGSGSGVIVSENGMMVTCAHVVDKADKIKAKLNDGREYEVKLLHVDKKNDLAIGKIILNSSEKLPAIALGDSEQLDLTEQVYAIGNAFGLGQSVTRGIVSAKTRILNGRVLLQTDASVNPGNSGGALVDESGRLVGVPNAILSRSGANHGIGFAIPAILIQSQLHRLQSDGTMTQKPKIGASVQTVTFDMAKSLETFDFEKFEGGAIVKKVLPESNAAKAGLCMGDIIVGVNGFSIKNEEELFFREETLHVGEEVTLKIWRLKSGLIDIKFKLDTIKDTPLEQLTIKGSNHLNGVTVAKINQKLLQEYELPEEALGKIIVMAAACDKDADGFGRLSMGINTGDIILNINGKDIVDLNDINASLTKKRRGIKLVLQRGGSILQLQIG
jgi:S1-C subfamily serine protease